MPTVMKLTDQVSLYPNATISGKSGTVVDTVQDVHWPLGPARVYLHPREVAEAVRVSHQLDEVSDVLKDAGWVPAADHETLVDELTTKLADSEERAQGAEAKLNAVLATIDIVSTASAPAEAASEAAPVAEPKKQKTAAKKKPEAKA